jgi:hypothetical protein
MVGIEIVKIFADSQYTPFAVHVTRESAFNRGVFKCGRKYLTRGLAHAAKLLVAAEGELGHR